MPGSVFVTGSSTGIGEATALRLARAGWHVFAGVRKEADGDRLGAAVSGRLTPVIVDVTDEAQIEAAVKLIDEEADGEGLAGVVNNAGVGRGGPIEFLPSSEWRHQLEVNVIGQVAVTRLAMPLIRRGGGRVVFMGSVAGRFAAPLFGPYAASKHALEAIAESLRHELRPWSMPVVLIEPGAIRTPIWAKGRAYADELEERMPTEARTLYGEQITATREGIDQQERVGIEPEAVAAVVERALTVPRPRARYTVGRDAAAMALFSRILPDRVKDAAVRKFSPGG